MSEEEEKPTFAGALRFLTDRERRLLADHPAPLELAAYHAGELSPEAEARIREHLALCRDCSDLLLNLAGFKKLTPPPGMPELTDEEVEEDWRAVRAKLGEGPAKEAAKVAEVVPIRPATPAATRGSEYSALRWWKVAAAVLATVSVIQGFWLIDFVKSRKAQSGPVAVFESGEVVRGPEEGDLPRMLSSQPGVFRFHLNGNVPRYAGEIVELGGAELAWNTEFTSAEIAQTDVQQGIVSFIVPADTLEPGEYRALLKGITDGYGGTIASIQFEVTAP